MLKIGFFWLVNFKYFVLIFKFFRIDVFSLCFEKRKCPKNPDLLNYLNSYEQPGEIHDSIN